MTSFGVHPSGETVWLFGLLPHEEGQGADARLALAAAVLSVLGIVLARRNEHAAWIARPMWYLRLLFSLGALALIFGAMYADAYTLHRRDLTPRRLSRDVCVGVAMAIAVAWSLRRQDSTARQLR